MKSKKIAIYTLVSFLITLYVMPFNIIKADSPYMNKLPIVSSVPTESWLLDNGLNLGYYNNTTHINHMCVAAYNQNVYFAYYLNNNQYSTFMVQPILSSYPSPVFYFTQNAGGVSQFQYYFDNNRNNLYRYRTSNDNWGDINSSIYVFSSLNDALSWADTIDWANYVPEEPEDEPTYGQLKIGFTSSIAYSGGNSNAWRNNKDTIYFDRYDTLGNDLKGLNIELQAIPYTTEASSKQNLLGQKFNEFFYDTIRVGSLGFYSPGQNPVDFTWEYITNRFSPTWWSTYGDNWSLTGWYLTDHWYKVGWAYRARVVDDEMNTIIDWQTIYNGTSIDAQDTDNIINNNGYTPELVNSINEVNNFNNTTNNNYYNNQTINYNDGTLTSDGSWIEEFIRGIFETIGNLIDLLGGVFKEIIDGIFSLIENLGVDILGIFTNLIIWFTDLIGSIDLTSQNYLVPQELTQNISTFSSWTNGVLSILFNSGFGLIVLIPFILFIVGLFV